MTIEKIVVFGLVAREAPYNANSLLSARNRSRHSGENEFFWQTHFRPPVVSSDGRRHVQKSDVHQKATSMDSRLRGDDDQDAVLPGDCLVDNGWRQRTDSRYPYLSLSARMVAASPRVMILARIIGHDCSAMP